MMVEMMNWLHGHEAQLQELGTVSFILIILTLVVLSIVVVKLLKQGVSPS
jgi:hypothetical protein